MTTPSSIPSVLTRSVPVTPELAAREYLEPISAYAVHNRYLRMFVVLFALLSAVLGIGLYRATTHIRPLVVRIDQFGEPTGAAYADMIYQPKEAEVKHFLIEFVQDHYSRNRATISDLATKQLYFLDAAQAHALSEEQIRTKFIQNFVSSSDDEVEITVHSVAIEDLRQAPYKARVEFEKVYHSPQDRHETGRERFTMNCMFTVLDQVPDNLIRVNPLGMVIQYFREDKAL